MTKKKYKQLIACLVSVAAIGSIFIGCGSSNTETKSSQKEQTQQNSTTDENKVQNDMEFGKVSKIEGSSITVQLLKNNKPDKQSNESVNDDSTNNTEKKTPPEKPSADQNSGEKPEDKGQGAPDGKGGPGKMENMFTETGEEKTIQVSDNVKITKGHGENASEAGISDITAGTIIEIKYDDSNKISELRIMMNEEQPQNKNGEASSADNNNQN